MDTVTCDVFNIELTFGAVTPGPPVIIPATPITLSSLGCISGMSVYSFLWVDFSFDPTGFTFDLDFDFKDSTGASIVLVSDLYTF